jgi:hypothetical protein
VSFAERCPTLISYAPSGADLESNSNLSNPISLSRKQPSVSRIPLKYFNLLLFNGLTPLGSPGLILTSCYTKNMFPAKN